MYDAARELARLFPHVTVLTAPLIGALAAVLPARRVVLVAERSTRAEQRCSLTHELIHLERGDRCSGGEGLDAKLEQAVDREAARRLIPLDHLAGALQGSGSDEAEVAQELDVDIHTLRTRLDNRRDDERRRLDATLRDWGPA